MVGAISQFGPEAMQKYLKMGAYFSQVATSLGMEAATIVKSDEQIQAEEQQAMQQQQAMMAQEQEGQMALEGQKQRGA